MRGHSNDPIEWTSSSRREHIAYDGYVVSQKYVSA